MNMFEKWNATSGKQHHCTTNDMVASAEKKFARMAHTPLLSKRFLKSTGESFGSDTLSDWCMQRDFGQLDWLHASNPDQSFPLLVSRLPLACSSYDIPPGWDEKLAEQGGSKFKWLSLIGKVETLVHLKERRGHKLSYSLIGQVHHVWTSFEK